MTSNPLMSAIEPRAVIILRGISHRPLMFDMTQSEDINYKIKT